MTTSQSPIGSRRRLGAELRRLRAGAGLTLDEVAERMTCSTSKISRLETGKGIPKIPDVRELMRIYDVRSDAEQDMLLRLVHGGREQGWWESYVDGVAPERYALDAPGRYPSLEGDATAIRSWDLAVVHGLLQTEEYARAVLMTVLPHHDSASIDSLVALRGRRQEALHRTDRRPLTFTTVVDESVLERVVGSATLMVTQLARLVELATLPNIDIRVLPVTAGLRRAHAGTFALLDIPAALGSDVVFLESHTGDSYLTDAADHDLYEDVFADALAHALSPDGSAAMIDRYRARHASR